MMKKLLPLLLCLSSTSSFAPTYVGRQASSSTGDMTDLFAILKSRFGRLHGEIIVVALSGGRMFAATPLDTKKRNTLTLELLENFAVDITDKGLDRMIFVPQYKMKFPVGSKRPYLESKIDSDSLVGKAMNYLYEKGILLKSDGLVNVSYGLRPWLTKDLKQTELVFGMVRVSRAGRAVDIPVHYPMDWEDDSITNAYFRP